MKRLIWDDFKITWRKILGPISVGALLFPAVANGQSTAQTETYVKAGYSGCLVLATGHDAADQVRYMGYCDGNGRASGFGVLQWYRNGENKAYSTYKGDMSDGKYNGNGDITFSDFPDDSFYVGQFNNNNMTGMGRYVFSSGMQIAGHFVIGKTVGTVTLTSTSEQVFRGEWNGRCLSNLTMFPEKAGLDAPICPDQGVPVAQESGPKSPVASSARRSQTPLAASP